MKSRRRAAGVAAVIAATVLSIDVATAQEPPLELVKDIHPESSNPGSLVKFDGKLYFAASNVIHGRELWKSDGTGAGTSLVSDIEAGSASSSPSDLYPLGTELFFSAIRLSTGGGGRELYKSTGTGAERFQDIEPGGPSSDPAGFTEVGGKLFFSARRSSHGRELYVRLPGMQGATEVKDIFPGASSGAPVGLTSAGGKLIFSAVTASGRELWFSDGSESTATPTSGLDINPGSASSNPSGLTNSNGIVFFAATEPSTGTELWTTNGTEAGTTRVKDIAAGTGSSSPTGLTKVGNQMYFAAASDSASGVELWRSDGSTIGTRKVTEIHPTAGSSPSNITDVGGVAYFSADNGTGGRELWRSDGTADGTQMVKDINPGAGSSSPTGIVNLGGTVFFSADDGVSGPELWRSDGTSAGTQRVSDLNPGAAASSPGNLTLVDGRLFFTATNSETGRELYAGRPVASPSPAATVFPATPTGLQSQTRRVTISAAGAAELVTGSLSIQGAQNNEFSIVDQNCSSRTLSPYRTCTVDIRFQPTSLGTRSAELRLSSNDPGSPLVVQLSGQGVSPDATPPETTITAGPTGATASTSASFTYESNETNSEFRCRLDGGAFEVCFLPQIYAGLSQGQHTFEVYAIDPFSNADPTPATRTWTVDSIAPTTSITSNDLEFTNDSTPTATFDSGEQGVTFECRYGAQAFAACSGPGASHTPAAALSEGTHVFQVRAKDAAGNIDSSPAEDSFIVDTVAPGTEIDTGPRAGEESDDSTPSFTFSDAGGRVASFECRFDSQPFAACSGPRNSHTPETPLSDGPHSFEVRSIDFAGNVDPTPASRSFTIDTSGPQSTITSGPADGTTINTRAVEFGFTSDDGTRFECSIRGDDRFESCESPVAYDLDEGEWRFQVRVIAPDDEVEREPESRTFTIDSTPPDTSIASGPSGPTADSTPSFTFTSDDAFEFECRIDAGEFGPCSGPGDAHTPASLPDGPHTFAVRAIDAALNQDPDPATRSFTVDTTAPQTTLGAAPSATNDTTPTFTYSSEAGATFACSLDGGPFQACSSEGFTAPTALSEGAHSFEVRASDSVSNTDPSPARSDFVVDVTSPNAAMESGPAGPTPDATPTFTYSSADPTAEFECRIDTQAFAPCGTSGFTPSTPLADGAHTFDVRAVDPAGNRDGTVASRSFRVDTVAPVTTIGTGPSGPVSDSTPTFTFSSNEPGSSFECSLDGGEFSGCGTPQSAPPLDDGAHTFRVRATDAAGNTEVSAAERSFTVDTAAPETTITAGPVGSTSDTTPSFAFESSEQGTTFVCKIDIGAFSPCSGPGANHTAPSPLNNGPHTFQVKSIDAAGNEDPSPDTLTFNVEATPTDTTPPETTLGSFKKKTTDRTPTFKFTSEAGAIFNCKVDQGAYAPCTSPYTTKKLKYGKHTVSVFAIDGAANADQSPATATFTVKKKR